MLQFLVFLDLETTSLDPTNGAIIEVALRRYTSDDQGALTLIDTYESFVAHAGEIPPEVVQITGITSSDLLWAPSWDLVRKQLEPFLQDALIIGHNISFDTGFLRANGMEVSAPEIDTFLLAQVVYGNIESLNLWFLAERFGFKPSIEHRAMADVVTNIDLWNHMLCQIKDMPLRQQQIIQQVFSRVEPGDPIAQFFLKALEVLENGASAELFDHLRSQVSQESWPTHEVAHPPATPMEVLQITVIEGATSLHRWRYFADHITQSTIPALVLLPTADHVSSFVTEIDNSTRLATAQKTIALSRIQDCFTLRNFEISLAVFIAKTLLAIEKFQSLDWGNVRIFTRDKTLMRALSWDAIITSAWANQILVMTHGDLMALTPEQIVTVTNGRQLILDDAGRYFWRSGQDSETTLTAENLLMAEKCLLALIEDNPLLREVVDTMTVISVSLFEDALALTHPSTREVGSYNDTFRVERSRFATLQEKYQRGKTLIAGQKAIIRKQLHEPLRSIIEALLTEFDVLDALFDTSKTLTGSGTTNGGSYRVILDNTLLRAQLHLAIGTSNNVIFWGYALTSVDHGTLLTRLFWVEITERTDLWKALSFSLLSEMTPRDFLSVYSNNLSLAILPSKPTIAQLGEFDESILSQLSMQKHRLLSRLKRCEARGALITTQLVDDSGPIMSIERAYLSKIPFYVPTDATYLMRYEVPEKGDFVGIDFPAMMWRLGGLFDLFPNALWTLADARLWGDVGWAREIRKVLRAE